MHHIESVKDAPTRLFDSSNLLALCTDCHNAVHGKADALNAIINDGVALDVVARVVATRGLPKGEGGCFNFRFGGNYQAAPSLV